MRQSVLVLAATTFLAVLLASPFSLASDGDVQYAAPYLWVDPETGELVTKNPGPQPKTHPQEPAASEAETAAAAAGGSAASAGPTAAGAAAQADSSGSAATGQQSGSLTLFAILAAIVVVSAVATITIRRINRGQSRRVAGGYAGEEGTTSD